MTPTEPVGQLAGGAVCGSTVRYRVRSSPAGPSFLPDTVIRCERPADHRGIHANENSAWGRE